MLWDQPFATSKAVEYRPLKPMRETVETNFMNNIHNLLPSDDDLYDIDHFLGLSTHENSTGDDVSCGSADNELKIDGSKITNLVQVNREKACDNYSVSPLRRTKIVFEVIFFGLDFSLIQKQHMTLPEGELRYWYNLLAYK
jgi:hypothetical protein